MSKFAIVILCPYGTVHCVHSIMAYTMDSSRSVYHHTHILHACPSYPTVPCKIDRNIQWAPMHTITSLTYYGFILSYCTMSGADHLGILCILLVSVLSGSTQFTSKKIGGVYILTLVCKKCVHTITISLMTTIITLSSILLLLLRKGS